jgi:hypothetical protein
MPFGEEKSLEINQEDSVFGSGSALIETFASDKIEITAKTGIYTAEFLDSRLLGRPWRPFEYACRNIDMVEVFLRWRCSSPDPQGSVPMASRGRGGVTTQCSGLSPPAPETIVPMDHRPTMH